MASEEKISKVMDLLAQHFDYKERTTLNRMRQKPTPFKILIACLLFIAFLAYVHFTGGSVEETINDAKNKGEEIIKEGREEINK